jgi:hypothetical protein
MPPTEVYVVEFANGTLTPTVDINAWGDMQPAGSVTGNQQNFVMGGLDLVAFRPIDPPGDDKGPPVVNSVYVTPAPGAVPIDSRLLIRVEFDRPGALPAGPGVKAEPWAVALKLADKPWDHPWQVKIAVTCQFNNETLRRNGVRLHDPDRS